MTIIAQLSDTHFGTEVPEVVSALERSLEALQPDIIIFSGDITQRARVDQFKAAADFIAKLPGRVKFIIPGNHDIPLYNIFQRIFTPLKNYEHFFGNRQNIYSDNEIVILGFDATSRWRHTRGKLLHNQVTELLQKVEKNAPPRICIACAHQPLSHAKPEDAENVLIYAEETAQLFADNGVDIVLSGHVHFPLISTTATKYLNVSPAIVLSGAGTATSYRIRRGAPNSYNIIRTSVDPQPSMTIQLVEYDKDIQRFQETPQQYFTKTAVGWRETR